MSVDWDENKKYDYRHGMGSSIGRGREEHDDESINVVRCSGCRVLNTEWEIRLLGMCRRCGGTKFNGAYPDWLEMIRIQFLHLTRSWRTRGWKSMEELVILRKKVTHAK